MWKRVVSAAKKSIKNAKKNKQFKNKMDSTSGDENAKKIMIFSSIGCSGSFFGIVLMVVVVAVILLSPLLYINHLLGKLKQGFESFTESLGNFLTFRGWCTDEECQEKEKNDFYEHIQDLDEKYNEDGFKLDTNLLVATLTYTNPSGWAEDDLENFIEGQSSGIFDYHKSKRESDDLAKSLVDDYTEYKEDLEACKETCKICQNGNNCEEDYEIDQTCVSDCNTNIVLEDYYTVTLNEFVKENYLDNADDEIKTKKIVEEIFQRIELYKEFTEGKGGLRFENVYGYCSGITVTNTNGDVIGVYDLETYVAGVISGEAYSGEEMEAYKAQAIAARTYALYVTDNCTNTIESSQNNQVFKDEIKDYATQAAQETTGLVLIYDGAIFKSEFDSYCYDDDDCNYYMGSDGKQYVTYTKLPNGEKHDVPLSPGYVFGGGHGRGMSQVASYEMADNGATYEEILKYFYSDGVQISQMVTITGGEYSSNTTLAQSSSELKERSSYYESLGTVYINNEPIDLSNIYPGDAGNLGQCVWYAKSRALELIYHSNMGDIEKLQSFNAILLTYANGEGWYDYNTLEMFERTTDYTQPRPGAIVSWSGGTHGYGHVAIIESVDYDNQTVVMSEGWNTAGVEAASIWSNVGYATSTVSFDSIYNKTGYTFNGYVYLLG